MFTKCKFNIVVTAMLAVILSACLPASPAQVQAALEQTQTASAVTPTLEPNQIIGTAIQQTFIAQTGQPPAATTTRTPFQPRTATPNAPAATSAVSAPTVSASVQPCLTDGQMQDAFGFTARGIKPVNTSVKSEGENCKWTLQAVGVYTFKDVSFVPGWELTVTLPDQSVRAYYGDGIKRDIMGATFRQRNGYAPDHWVNDPDRLLAHEFNFGWSQGRDPNYLTVNGNLSTTNWNNYDGSYCPTNSVQVAGLVGGEPNYWTVPTWPGGAWVFAVPRDNKNQPTAFLLLTAAEVKGADTWIDYWNSQKSSADTLKNWQSLALADASYNCHPK